MSSRALTPELVRELERLSGELSAFGARAFLAGQLAGATATRTHVATFIRDKLHELERGVEGVSAADAAEFQAHWDGVEPSPILAAYLGSATDAYQTVLYELERLADDERDERLAEASE